MNDETKPAGANGGLLRCSFCGKSRHEVRKLVAGPSVFICDECVGLSVDIIREEVNPDFAAPPTGLPHALPPGSEIRSVSADGVTTVLIPERREEFSRGWSVEFNSDGELVATPPQTTSGSGDGPSGLQTAEPPNPTG